MRLVADNVCVARSGQIFFSGISFSLDTGEALVVSGPNGVGKSTFLRVVAGLLPDAEGRIELEGGGGESVAESAHYLGHRNAMKPALSVRENLEFWRDFMAASEAYQTKVSAGVDEAVAMVGLAGIGHLPVGYLSAGQQRRIAMAKLLTAHRPLWILDEPTAALDVQSQDMFARLIEAHLEDGGLVIAATHQPLGLTGARSLVLDPGAQAAFGANDPFAPEDAA